MFSTFALVKQSQRRQFTGLYELERSFCVPVLILCDTHVAAVQPLLIVANSHLTA